MIKRILSLAVLGAAAMSNTGCKSGDGVKKINGIEYQIVKDAPGTPAKIGDFIDVHLIAKVDTAPGKSWELGNTYTQNNNEPISKPVDTGYSKGQFENVFRFLSVGDSAVVRISCDTLISTIPAQQRGQLPPWLKPGNTIVVSMKAVSVKSKDQYMKEMQEKQKAAMEKMQADEAAQAPIDDKAIQDYIAANNIKATKTESGLYYAITKAGSGANAKAGQSVSMKYLGKTLEGEQFDANMDDKFNLLKDKQIFTFTLGQGQVIRGWDEGLQLLNKGSRATLILPSKIAYGVRGNGPIKPNSVLVFNVEMTDIKDAPAQQNVPAPPAQ